MGRRSPLIRYTSVNLQALLEGVSFLAAGGVTAAMLATGRYLSFVAPRLFPCLCLMAAVMTVWGGVSLRQMGRPVYRFSYGHCLTLLIPVLLFAGPLLLGTAYSPGIGAVSAAAAETADDVAEKPYGIDFDADHGSGIDNEGKRIILTTANYYSVILTLTKDIKAYEGYDIYMIGFVSYSDGRLKDNSFVLARYLMFCCVNDLSPFGLDCLYTGNKRWPENQWVAVKGTVTSRTYHSRPQPTIQVEKIVPAKRVPGYVYPQ